MTLELPRQAREEVKGKRKREEEDNEEEKEEDEEERRRRGGVFSYFYVSRFYLAVPSSGIST